MLIGADVYWNIVSGNVKRNPEIGLIAISSALGWLVNGTVEKKPVAFAHNINVTMSHVLRVQ